MFTIRLGKSILPTALTAGLLFFMAQAAQAQPRSVVLSEFYAIVQNDTAAIILWTTESEQNSYQWLLERAVDSLGPYHLRATLPAAGNSTMPTYYDYTDHPLHPDTLYYYRLAEVDLGGTVTYFGPITVCTGVEEQPVAELKVASLKLLQNAPNPFRQTTTIRYQITRPGWVSLKVYNMAGQLVRTLVSEYKVAGWHEVRWEGRDERGMKVFQGLYCLQLKSEGIVTNCRMIKLTK